MKKLAKTMTILMSLLIFLIPVSNSSIAFASDSEQNNDSILNDLIITGDDHAKLIKEKGVQPTKSEVYVKISESDDISTTNYKVYSEAEYNKEQAKSRNNSYARVRAFDFGWVKLTTEIYDTSFLKDDQVSIYYKFQWLQVPNFYMKDVVGIKYDTALTVDHDQSRFTYFPDATNYPQCYKTYTQYRFNTPLIESAPYGSYSDKTGFAGFTFKLVDTDIAGATSGLWGFNNSTKTPFLRSKPSGAMSIIAYNKNSYNKSAEIGLLYSHQQYGWEVEPKISVTASGVSISGGVGTSIGFDTKLARIFYKFGSNI